MAANVRLRFALEISQKLTDFHVSTKNGEAGIRTLGRLAPTPVFKTGSLDAEVGNFRCICINHGKPCGARIGTSDLHGVAMDDADLQDVIEAWSALPANIKEAITAIIWSQRDL